MLYVTLEFLNKKTRAFPPIKRNGDDDNNRK